MSCHGNRIFIAVRVLACRAGRIFPSSAHIVKSLAAILNFSCSGKLERETSFPKGLNDRQEEEQGWGGAKKISPARGHCSFRKLRSPMNGVSDWCGLTLPVSFVSFVRVRNMANSVDSGVVNQFRFRKCLCELGMSREVRAEQKDAISTLVSGKEYIKGCCCCCCCCCCANSPYFCDTFMSQLRNLPRPRTSMFLGIIGLVSNSLLILRNCWILLILVQAAQFLHRNEANLVFAFPPSFTLTFGSLTNCAVSRTNRSQKMYQEKGKESKARKHQSRVKGVCSS